MSAPRTQPQHLGPYRLLEKIGEGGMGVVHLAVTADGDLVAVKALRPWLVAGQDGRRRLEREVASLRRVRGERVAEVVDADVAADPPYVVTRYVRGPNLDKVVGDHGPLRGAALDRLSAGLAEALASVHAAGIVHRDVKPGNVLMADDGPVLIDFGLARALDGTRLTATGMIVGTPGYLAPEVVSGAPPTAATDVHGWAATVAFAATGRPPFGDGPDAVVLDRIRRNEHDVSGIEPGLAAVLSAALDADPARRPTVPDLGQRLGIGDRVAALSETAPPEQPTQVTPAADAPTEIRPAAAAPPKPASPSDAPTEMTPASDAPTEIRPAVEAPTEVRPAEEAQTQITRATEPPTQIVRPTHPPTRIEPAPVRPPVQPRAAETRETGRPAAQPRRPQQRPSTPAPGTPGVAPPLRTWPARFAITAAWFAVLLLTALEPRVGIGMLLLIMIVTRTAWRVRQRLYARRVVRGYQPRDNWITAAGTPLHVLVTALQSAVHVAVICLAAFVVAVAVDAADIGGPRLPYLAGATVAVLLTWLGPATGRIRNGARVLTAPLDRDSRGAWVVFGVVVAVIWLLLLIWEGYGTGWPPVDNVPNPIEQLFQLFGG